MKNIYSFTFLLIIGLLLINSMCFADRFALVIGNSEYKGIPLKNPVNDANDIASTLKDLDFKVTKRTNLNKQTLIEISNLFEKSITSNDEVLFYYSGHGVQVDGVNYLIPINSNISKEREIEFEAVSLNRIISCLSKARLNIIILDACRDNPFKGFRSASKGLAQITSKTEGTFIAYSTAPGNVAIDGSGRNSPYTKNLISKMKSNMNIEKVFKEVRIAVKEETDSRQIPWDSSSLTEDFYFNINGEFEETKNEIIHEVIESQEKVGNYDFIFKSEFIYESIIFNIPYNLKYPELTIFDIQGRMIKKYYLEKYLNEIIWDGTDSDDNIVAKGVYFLLITDGENFKSKVKKCAFGY